MSKRKKILKEGNTVAVGTFFDDVIPCPAGKEIEIVSVRFAFALDATVASRFYQLGINERDGGASALQYFASQVNALAATNVGVIQFGQGLNSEVSLVGALQPFVSVQLLRLRLAEPTRLRIIAVGGQAGDIAGPIEVNFIERDRL